MALRVPGGMRCPGRTSRVFAAAGAPDKILSYGSAAPAPVVRAAARRLRPPPTAAYPTTNAAIHSHATAGRRLSVPRGRMETGAGGHAGRNAAQRPPPTARRPPQHHPPQHRPPHQPARPPGLPARPAAKTSSLIAAGSARTPSPQPPHPDRAYRRTRLVATPYSHTRAPARAGRTCDAAPTAPGTPRPPGPRPPKNPPAGTGTRAAAERTRRAVRPGHRVCPSARSPDSRTARTLLCPQPCRASRARRTAAD